MISSALTTTRHPLDDYFHAWRDRRCAAKRVARMASAPERTARSWIEGRARPSFDYVAALMRADPEFRERVIAWTEAR